MQPRRDNTGYCRTYPCPVWLTRQGDDIGGSANTSQHLATVVWAILESRHSTSCHMPCNPLQFEGWTREADMILNQHKKQTAGSLLACSPDTRSYKDVFSAEPNHAKIRFEFRIRVNTNRETLHLEQKRLAKSVERPQGPWRRYCSRSRISSGAP